MRWDGDAVIVGAWRWYPDRETFAPDDETPRWVVHGAVARVAHPDRPERAVADPTGRWAWFEQGSVCVLTGRTRSCAALPVTPALGAALEAAGRVFREVHDGGKPSCQRWDASRSGPGTWRIQTAQPPDYALTSYSLTLLDGGDLELCGPDAIDYVDSEPRWRGLGGCVDHLPADASRWIDAGGQRWYLSQEACEAAAAAPRQPAQAADPRASGARTSPGFACRVRTSTGPTSGTYYERRLTSTGQTIEIRLDASGATGRDRWFYDAHGRVVRRESTSSQEQYRSPHGGPLDRGAAWSARTVVYEYDARGRRTRAVHARSGVDLAWPATPTQRYAATYHYSGDHLVAIDNTRPDPPETWRFVYDGPHLVQERQEVNGRVTLIYGYGYDASGRREREVVLSTYVPSPSQSTSLYVYDAAGRLTAKGVPGGAMPYQLEYDGLGRVARFKRDQFETRYHYDAIGRIVGIVHAGPTPDAGAMSEYLGYSEGCTAAITAGLIPRPVDDLMTLYYDAADPRWLAVRADREEPPGF